MEPSANDAFGRLTKEPAPPAPEVKGNGVASMVVPKVVTKRERDGEPDALTRAHEYLRKHAPEPERDGSLSIGAALGKEEVAIREGAIPRHGARSPRQGPW